MNYIKISKNDIANGIGVRVVLWVAGCTNHCEECHNQETWDFNAGQLFDENAKKELFEALDKSWIQGITFSGGDPMHPKNRDTVISLINDIREKLPEKDIWVYTGYLYETLPELNVDVLVDGKFIKNLYDISLPWCGSKNQRVIDVKKTKKLGKIKLLEV